MCYSNCVANFSAKGERNMRDIPFFTTQNGVAGLTLKEIPYTSCGYITLLDASDAGELLNECKAFCIAAGADKIYATGHPILERFLVHTTIFIMSCEKAKIPQTNAIAIPATQETAEKWREIYNNKMQGVPNAAYMTITECQKATKKGTLYFVYEEDAVIGIGSVDADSIGAVASVIPGKGMDVVGALSEKIVGDMVCLDVASVNDKAMRLYEKMGFQITEERSKWYQIK